MGLISILKIELAFIPGNDSLQHCDPPLNDTNGRKREIECLNTVLAVPAVPFPYLATRDKA